MALELKWQRDRSSADGDEMQFSMTMIIGHEFAMTDAFDHLTGAYGDLNHMTERARWVTTNGTHDLEGDMNESFPPAGWQFRCFWA